MRVLSGETEGCRVLVVDLVNVLVERAPVQRAVREEVEHVLKDEEECDLQELLLPWGEGHLPGGHAERLSHRVEEPDLHETWDARETNRVCSAECTSGIGKETYDRELNHEVREQDLLRALPLLLRRRDLVGLQLPLPEVRDRVDDNPWYAATEVDDLRGTSSNRRTSNAATEHDIPREARNLQARSRGRGC